jgi:hypothetical protein
MSLLVGVGSVAFIAIKLLTVAGGDPETAYAILQSQGTGAVLVGSLVSVVGLIAAPFAFVLILHGLKPHRGVPSGPAMSHFYVIGFGLLMVSVVTAPAGLLIESVVCALLLTAAITAMHARFGSKARVRFPFNLASANFTLAYAMSIIIIGLISSSPWLPAENISLRHNLSFTGYVLSDSNGRILVLTYDPTGVVQFPQGDILGTRECEPHDYKWFQATPWELISGVLDSGLRAYYSACPHKTTAPVAYVGAGPGPPPPGP